MTVHTYEHKYRLAQAFERRWKNEKREEAEAKTFWDEFFRIFNLDRYKTTSLEYAVKHHRQKTTKFADVFWVGRLLCEHKSANKDLDKAFAQAAGYVDEIRRHNPEDVPRHVIVCDFATMRLYDLQADTRIDFPLEDLPEQIKNRNFDFMDGIGRDLKAAEEQANIEAADAVGSLYQAFRADTAYNEHALKQFIIRLLFCFFADDTLIFDKGQFEDYLRRHTKEDGSDTGSTLNQIFQVLDTPPDKRPARMNSELKAFPHVNGKLFEHQIDEFYFDAELRQKLLECSQRDWAKISPEIFGSLFQSVMDGNERRAAGAHYTEEANILKVIDSLFMNSLSAELAAARKSGKAQRRKLAQALHEKIGRLNFLDPACGCGNFLVVAYRELRRLEDEIIGELFAENQLLDIATMQRVHIGQFHGIELDEYPAQIAKVAMWLTDHQCNLATAERFGTTRPTIPLTDSAEIINANALHTEWPQADYIFGNPPFIGKAYQSAAQKADMAAIAGRLKNSGVLDYVSAWYLKAADIMEHSHQQSITPPPDKNLQSEIQTAFVSTNSICQGDQAATLWQPLFERGIRIQFAHQTFQWQNQAKGVAAVHCIIVGFAFKQPDSPTLFRYPDIKGEAQPQAARNINAYLIDADNVAIEKSNIQITNETGICFGSMPNDGGHLLLTPEEKTVLLEAEPLAKQYIRPFLGAEEFLNGKQRWCLWFDGCDLEQLNRDLKKMPQVAQRIEKVKTARQESKRAATQKLAATPHLFGEIRQPASGNYLAIPEVSSEKRNYIPIGFLDSNSIVSNKIYTLSSPTPLYHFGLLMSAMHNAFMRTVAGRLESRYQYSAGIVYNNFPFPFAAQTPSESKNGSAPPAAEQKARAKIEEAAQKVLDVREQYRQAAVKKGSTPPTLAQLYNPYTVHPYPDLLKAHQALDKAVDAAYGYTGKNDDADRVAFLFDVYRQHQTATPEKKPRKKAV